MNLEETQMNISSPAGQQRDIGTFLSLRIKTDPLNLQRKILHYYKPTGDKCACVIHVRASVSNAMSNGGARGNPYQRERTEDVNLCFSPE